MTEAVHDLGGTDWGDPSQDLGSPILPDVVAEAARASERPQIQAEETFLAIACMASAPTLAKAIDRGSRFYATLARAAGCAGLRTMELRVSARGAELRFFTGGPGPHERSSFTTSLIGAVFHVRLLGWLVGDQLALTSIATSHRPAIARDDLAEIMPWPIEFSAALGPACDFQVTFPARYLSRPIVRGGRDLEELNLLELLFAAPPQKSVAMTVRHMMLGALRRGVRLPSATRLAALCNRSPASLRRHLAREATSVREIRDECIRTRALQLLQDRSITLGEIAARLGFSDAPCFRRAFRRWTGSSPAAYRRGIVGTVLKDSSL